MQVEELIAKTKRSSLARPSWVMTLASRIRITNPLGLLRCLKKNIGKYVDTDREKQTKQRKPWVWTLHYSSVICSPDAKQCEWYLARNCQWVLKGWVDSEAECCAQDWRQLNARQRDVRREQEARMAERGNVGITRFEEGWWKRCRIFAHSIDSSKPGPVGRYQKLAFL